MSNDHIGRPPGQPTRRGVLKGAAALSALAVLPREAAAADLGHPAAIPTLEFLAASAKLTGIALDRSYMQMADTLWALLALDGHVKLRLLVAAVNSAPEGRLDQILKALGLRKIARTVMTAWYSGSVQVPAKYAADPLVKRLTGETAAGSKQPVTVVFNYDEALVWQACRFTKASATCGGPFGYWHLPPT